MQPHQQNLKNFNKYVLPFTKRYAVRRTKPDMYTDLVEVMIIMKEQLINLYTLLIKEGFYSL